MQNIIIANYSIHSIALIIWAKNNIKKELYVLSVDTGFAANNWNKYLKKVFVWLNSKNITYYHLKAKYSFHKLVKARKNFPSQENSWCSIFLKGITLLDKIDELDPNCEATILLPNRKDLSKSFTLLNEYTREEEKYDYRKVWYPLLEHTEFEVLKLLEKIPFHTRINRSLECQPCIYLTRQESKKISKQDIEKVIKLEKQINKFMFNYETFDKAIQNSNFFKRKNIIEELSKACSWEYGCGL